MAKLLSPGVQIREIDLTNFVPNVGNSGGAFVGQFHWGPVDESLIINDANTLAKIFGKPSDDNYVDWFSASNFLAYNDNLRVVRVVDDSTAKNASVDGTGLLVKNQQHYQIITTAQQGTTDLFVARCPGAMGNSLAISIADSNTFNDWKYKDEFDYIKPGTSNYSKNLGAANDELHLVVIDSKGKFTGVPGSILEKYAFLSKALDSKNDDNEPNFYGNVLNLSSKYVWYFGPIAGNSDLDIDGYISALSIDQGGTGYGKPIITITDYNPQTEAPGPGDGVGATAVAEVNENGEIVNVILTNAGNGYTAPVYVTVKDSGNGASAVAQTTAGVITAINIVNGGSDYYSSKVTIIDQGSGATGTATLAATGKIKTIDIANGGDNYEIDDILTIAGGTTTVKVTGISGGGSAGPITNVTIETSASNYANSATGVASTGGNGTGATFDIVVGKEVASLSITNPGSNYGNAKVTFSGGNPTTSAVATATVSTSGVNKGQVTALTLTNNGDGYESAPTFIITPKGAGASASATIGAIGSLNEGKIVSIQIANGGTDYGNPKVTIEPGGSGAQISATVIAGDTAGTNWGRSNADMNGNPVSFFSLKQPYEKQFNGGLDGEKAGANEIIAGWNQFKSSEEVDVGLLFVGNAGGSSTSKTVIRHVIDNICEYRRDCMVFFSPNLTDVLNRDQVDATNLIRNFITDNVNGINRSTSFAVCDTGWKLQYDVFADKYRWIPLNADIAGLCAATETDYDAWWSPAGLNRGKIKNIVSLAFNPNKASRDELYKANINSVVSFTGEGTFLYGDRTLLVKNSAFSYINVRRLFIVLEKSISKAAKYNLFEFNDEFTRGQFVGMVEPYLRRVRARRGIYDFRVICDESNNTPEVIDNAEFVASIFIKPARSINFITLNFVAVRTGVEFSEVVGVV